MILIKAILFISFGNYILCAPWTLNKPIEQKSDSYNVEYYDRNYESDLQNEDDYHTYMEQKVAKIIYNGGTYLEGLKRALQKYGERIDNCTNNYRRNDINFTDPTQQIDYNKCQKEVMESEKVRRVAQLAIVTTREIQDRKLYEHHEDELENKSLLLRLAWLLDRLAQMTGFEPRPEDYLTPEPTAPPTTGSTINMLDVMQAQMNVSTDRKMMMINCLNRTDNSTEPAYRRCPQEAPMINMMRDMYNRSGKYFGGNVPILQIPDLSPPQILGLLTPSASLNASDSQPSETNLDVITSKIMGEKLEKSFPKIPQNGARKRREIYYNKQRKPISRIPEDPYQDISGYVKSKPGTNFNINPQDGVRLRLDLERAFQNPNIEITRRYGANYNPANPNVIFSGIIRSLLDV